MSHVYVNSPHLRDVIRFDFSLVNLSHVIWILRQAIGTLKDRGKIFLPTEPQMAPSHHLLSIDSPGSGWPLQVWDPWRWGCKDVKVGRRQHHLLAVGWKPPSSAVKLYFAALLSRLVLKTSNQVFYQNQNFRSENICGCLISRVNLYSGGTRIKGSQSGEDLEVLVQSCP